MNQPSIKILFVCLGNICRSATAEAVMKEIVKNAGKEKLFEIDSAGILNYHEGEEADSRMKAHAARRGYVLDSISRPVSYNDFDYFDYIIGMDDRNISDLQEKAPTQESLSKISKMTDYALDSVHDHVPDPYYGGAQGFELVLDLLENACQGLYEKVMKDAEL